jgi:hypothetical protein
MGQIQDLTLRKPSAAKPMLREKLYSQRTIAGKLGMSAASVNRIKKKLDMGKELCPQRKAICGAMALFNPRTKRILIRKCVANRRSTD